MSTTMYKQNGSNILKAKNIARPKYVSWARAAGEVIEQNPITRENMRAILLEWEKELKLVVLRVDGQWRSLGDILEDLAVFGKHEDVFRAME